MFKIYLIMVSLLPWIIKLKCFLLCPHLAVSAHRWIIGTVSDGINDGVLVA